MLQSMLLCLMLLSLGAMADKFCYRHHVVKPGEDRSSILEQYDIEYRTFDIMNLSADLKVNSIICVRHRFTRDPAMVAKMRRFWK